MVTAGVYLVARCHSIFERSLSASNWVAWIGALTAFLAATVALVQKDLKRILAYSTISQLGYMFLGAGVGAYAAGIFHLMTHAFFKALLFLCAGSISHALAGELDIFKMGGLRKKMPWTFGTCLVGILALAGVPLLSGFFSKDEILYRAWEQGSVWLWLVGAMTAGLTAFYAFRLLFVVFFGKERMSRKAAASVHESPWILVAPLVILAVLAAAGGYVGLPKVLGLGNAIGEFLEPVFAGALPAEGPHAEGEAVVEWGLMAASVVVAAAGALVAYWLYVRRWGTAERWTRAGQWLYDVVYNKYYADEAYMEVVVKPLKTLGDALSGPIEERTIDGAVNGLARLVSLAGEGVRRLQTGLVRTYALLMLLGVVALVGYFVVRGILGG
jgi:NADH-quinone oxidoreductase subunit L